MIRLLAALVVFFSINVDAALPTAEEDGKFGSIPEFIPILSTVLEPFGTEPASIVTITDDEGVEYGIKLGGIAEYVSSAVKKVVDAIAQCSGVDPAAQLLPNKEEMHTTLQSICPLLLLCFDLLLEEHPEYKPLVGTVIENVRKCQLDPPSDDLFSEEIIELMTKYVEGGDIRSLVRREGGLISTVIQKHSKVEAPGE